MSGTYLVNVPLYFDGNLETLEKNVEEILSKEGFQGQRKCKILIGLNQKEGTVDDEAIQKGIEKANEIIQKRLKENGNVQAVAVNYSWTPLPSGAIDGFKMEQLGDNQELVCFHQNGEKVVSFMKKGVIFYDPLLQEHFQGDSKIYTFDEKNKIREISVVGSDFFEAFQKTFKTLFNNNQYQWKVV